MRYMKTVQIPATAREEVERLTCDFCGNTIRTQGHTYTEITLQREDVSSYPECSSGTKTVFDCCVDCWDGKVMPALQTLGASPRTEEWDW